MDGKSKCLFCGFEADIIREYKSRRATVNCPNCLSYRTTDRVLKAFQNKYNPQVYMEKKHIISGYIREMNELGLEIPFVDADEKVLAELADNSRVPKTLMEKLDKLLLYLYNRTDTIGRAFTFNDDNILPAVAYARDVNEFYNIIDWLMEMGFLGDSGNTLKAKEVFLTVKGLEYAEKLHKEHPKSNQVFVARWFDSKDRMKRLYLDAIKPACKACGYDAIDIDEKEYNGDIVDRIISESRKSRFVIADFTGQRGGVYFEAGYAEGMGLPLICIWDKTIVNEKGFENEKLHFDIEHRKAIFYSSAEDLKMRLIDRIRATIGDYKGGTV